MGCRNHQIGTDAQQHHQQSQPSNQSLGTQFVLTASRRPGIRSIDGRITVHIRTILVRKSVHAIPLNTVIFFIKGGVCTLPFLPWGSTQPAFFMVSEYPMRFFFTMGSWTLLSPIFFKSVFLPLQQICKFRRPRDLHPRVNQRLERSCVRRGGGAQTCASE